MTTARTASWTVVATGAATTGEVVVDRRRLVIRVLVLTAVVALAVLIGSVVVAQRLAADEAVSDAAQRGGILALDVVQPVLRDGIVRSEPAAVAALDAQVRASLLGPDIVRVKLWRADGTVLYSDEPRLIGRHFSLEEEYSEALEHDGVEAGISDLAAPDNRYERGHGSLLEVYRTVHTPDGERLLFETYFRYDDVLVRAQRIWLGFATTTGASLLLLLLALVPLLRRLVRSLEQARDQRELLLQRTLEASDDERRRIAATLHDGPVQDLVGASYLLGAASSAVAGSSTARVLDEAERTTRSTVDRLRSMLVDLYPPSLAEGGLQVALEELVAAARSRAASVEVHLDPARRLPGQVERLVFRVTRETVANAVKHGDGAPIVVTVAQRPHEVVLTVEDEGPGFDVPVLLGRPRTAHFGLRLLRDAVLDSGVDAELAVRSGRGAGTTWRLTARF